MRCFLALLLDEDVRDHLVQIQESLADPWNEVRWIRPENLHLTLQFLGEWEQRELDGLAELLEELPVRKPLELDLGELGILGSRSRPRIVQVGLCGQVDRLQELVAEIGEAVELALGLPPEKRAYYPHITLGRIRKAQPGLTERLESRFPQCSHEAHWPMPPVTSFSLMHSRLGPSGATYRQLRESCFARMTPPD